MNAQTASSEAARRGRLIRWNDDRGYGFICPEDGSADVFVHISAFDPQQRRPEQNDVVLFETDRSRNKPQAVNVQLKGLPFPPTVAVAYVVGGLCLTIHFLFVLGLIDLRAPIIGYLLMSIITFGFYLADKRRAERGEWRLTETSLHVLEALGGWPGALVAQAALRHKTRKPAYHVVLWSIVAVHVGAWTLWYMRHHL